MRLFIDSADATLWHTTVQKGWLFGATTNPSILQKEGRGAEMETYATLASEAERLGLRELHIQATGTTIEALHGSGVEIAALWDRVVVKVPMTRAGLPAAAKLQNDGIRITLTAAHAPHQVLTACAANADYVAPYFGRLMDVGVDAEAAFRTMLQIRNTSEARTRILVASLRSLDQLEMLAAMGHDTFTLAPDLADRLGMDPKTDGAAEMFEAAQRNAQER